MEKYDSKIHEQNLRVAELERQNKVVKKAIDDHHPIFRYCLKRSPELQFDIKMLRYARERGELKCTPVDEEVWFLEKIWGKMEAE